MARGISVHVGVNDVDSEHYGGWSSPLKACENDARDMFELAQSQGFDSRLLVAADATRDAVKSAVEAAAATLASGDLFFMTYAGHGGQLKDMDGDEEDLKDETWCLYDGQLIDDELNVLWARFVPNVRVLVLSDSCHSGSVSKGASAAEDNQEDDPQSLARFMPRGVALKTFKKNYEFYDNIQFSLPDPRPEIQATVRLISGCQDHQKSRERDGNGEFTRALKTLWAGGAFTGSYDEFHAGIRNLLPDTQQPNHLVLGRPDPDYDRQRPFTI